MTRESAVFDASVFVRAVVDGTRDALAWTARLGDGTVDAIAPALVYPEFANAIVQAVRRGRITAENASESIRSFVALPLDVRSNRALCAVSFALAIDTGLTAYDAHYLALAEAEDAILVTADRGLAAAASRSVLLA